MVSLITVSEHNSTGLCTQQTYASRLSCFGTTIDLSEEHIAICVGVCILFIFLVYFPSQLLT
ncbi:hypothetical protein B0H19DRAFT_1256729 [Mycena capillaripes]|nr:hypothetical protein B0H19DRAFT_1256729 [Mycena capillaripes]